MGSHTTQEGRMEYEDTYVVGQLLRTAMAATRTREMEVVRS